MRRGKSQKAGSTRMASETVPHSPTDRALLRLTSEFGRDPVHSTWYGRQHGWWRPALVPSRRPGRAANTNATDLKGHSKPNPSLQ